MSEVCRVECRSCGARLSGVRTEFGSLILPGRADCPRCGAAEFAEVTGADGAAGSAPRSPADAEAGADSGARTEE